MFFLTITRIFFVIVEVDWLISTHFRLNSSNFHFFDSRSNLTIPTHDWDLSNWLIVRIGALICFRGLISQFRAKISLLNPFFPLNLIPTLYAILRHFNVLFSVYKCKFTSSRHYALLAFLTAENRYSILLELCVWTHRLGRSRVIIGDRLYQPVFLISFVQIFKALRFQPCFNFWRLLQGR